MKSSSLPPWVIQVFGLCMIAVFVVVKIKTGQESLPLVGVGVTLVTGGGIAEAARAARRALLRAAVKASEEEKEADSP